MTEIEQVKQTLKDSLNQYFSNGDIYFPLVRLVEILAGERKPIQYRIPPNGAYNINVGELSSLNKSVVDYWCKSGNNVSTGRLEILKKGDQYTYKNIDKWGDTIDDFSFEFSLVDENVMTKAKNESGSEMDFNYIITKY